jgi:type VI secretion system protein ImpM
MPSRGDFLQRGLPASFIDPWDEWLQRSIAASRAALGGAWLDAYLTSPIWRFAISGGVIDGSIWTGAMMPSVDRVNRYFPLAIVTEVTDTSNVFELLETGGDWFQNVEDLLLKALDHDDLDLDEYAAEISGLGSPVWAPDADAPANMMAIEVDGIRVAIADGLNLTSAAADMLQGLLRQQYGSISLWWTAGSENVSPVVRVFSALPSTERFNELLADPNAVIQPLGTDVQAPLEPEFSDTDSGSIKVPMPDDPELEEKSQAETVLEGKDPVPDFNLPPLDSDKEEPAETPSRPDLPPGKTGTILDALDRPKDQ